MLTKISKISVLAERVIKNWRSEPSKISKKSIKKWCKNRSFFWLIFYRFLVDVGPMLGPKILIKSMKIHSKIISKTDRFFCFILCWFMLDFGSKLGGPREALGRSWKPTSSLLGVLIGSGASLLGVLIGSWVQDGPKWPQNNPKWHRVGPKMTQVGPKLTQVGTKCVTN